jgi:hypothetical protein
LSSWKPDPNASLVNSRVKRDKNGQIELTGQGAYESGRLWEL